MGLNFEEGALSVLQRWSFPEVSKTKQMPLCILRPRRSLTTSCFHFLSPWFAGTTAVHLKPYSPVPEIEEAHRVEAGVLGGRRDKILRADGIGLWV